MDKQIEELTSIIDSFNIRTYANAQAVAKFLVEKYGYRKIPEGYVVLTREEFERHKGFSREEVDEISKTAIKNSRKETAKAIIDMLIPSCEVCDENWHKGCLCLRTTTAEKIAKQYGVEDK